MKDVKRAINGMKGFYMILEPLLLKANYEEKGKEDVVELKEDIGLAIQALKKQTPKKPQEVDVDFSTFVCPNCLSTIMYTDEKETHNYCLSCGQKLDWRVEE